MRILWKARFQYSIPVLLLTIAGLCGAQQAAKADKQGSAQRTQKAAAPARLVLPEGAKQVAPATYTYTDKDGKKWIYRRTPFGLVKFVDNDAEQDEALARSKQAELDNTTATANGDSIHFERNSPFGKMRWDRKKSELNEMEKTVWERDSQRAVQQKAGKE